ncbi:hypothetical protein EVA_13149, partial [gut metagenome]
KGEAQITQFGTKEGLAPVMFEDKKDSCQSPFLS